VPLISTAIDSNGSLATSTLTTFQTAADAAIAAAGSGFIVWSRPGPLGAGVTSIVTGASIADVAASLKSRRT
jgi:hypothetical protein